MFERIRTWLTRPKVDLSSVNPRFLRKQYHRADWSGSTFANFVPVGCRFSECIFENVIFQHVCFGGGSETTTYERCSFDRSTINAPAAGRAQFLHCSFRNVNIQNFEAPDVDLAGCTFSGTIRRASFTGKASGVNDFSGAQFSDVLFGPGIDLSLQKLPAGWKNEA